MTTLEQINNNTAYSKSRAIVLYSGILLSTGLAIAIEIPVCFSNGVYTKLVFGYSVVAIICRCSHQSNDDISVANVFGCPRTLFVRSSKLVPTRHVYSITMSARPCPWIVVLLACLCSVIGARAFSAYDKKLELLSTIVNKDYQWKHIFQEGIVYKLDRTYYQHIIDDELLKNARCEPPDTEDVKETSAAAADGEGTTGDVKASGSVVTSSSTPPENDTRDRIVPYEFVKNIMINNRFVVGSILDMGIQVLMVSFKCLLYKHMVHLIHLIRVEIKRSTNQKKAASWSGKSKPVIESILMTMGALQFTDIHVLATLSFFEIYKMKGTTMEDDVKNKYCDDMEKRSKEMMDYISDNCVVTFKKGTMSKEEQVANMIGVYTIPELYKIGGSFSEIKNYKEMVKDSWLKLSFFDDIPRINGISTTTWNDILHYYEELKKDLMFNDIVDINL